jgi:hypothetical protein
MQGNAAMAIPTQLESLMIRFDIEQALFRYARGVDRKEWDLVRSAYHADATDLHGAFEGGIDEFIAHLIQRHENIEQSIHAITNILVEIEAPGIALAESYFVCDQRLKSAQQIEKVIGAADVGPTETLQITVVGRYLDRFELRDGSWRIARRKVAFDVIETHATPLGGGLDAILLLSKRDRTDVLFTEQKAVR